MAFRQEGTHLRILFWLFRCAAKLYEDLEWSCQPATRVAVGNFFGLFGFQRAEIPPVRK